MVDEPKEIEIELSLTEYRRLAFLASHANLTPTQLVDDFARYHEITNRQATAEIIANISEDPDSTADYR